MPETLVLLQEFTKSENLKQASVLKINTFKDVLTNGKQISSNAHALEE